MNYRIVVSWFLCVTALTAESEQLAPVTQEQIDAELFSAHSGRHGSSGALEKDLDLYKKTLKNLGTSPLPSGTMPTVKKWLGDVAKIAVGATGTVAGGMFAPMLLRRHGQRPRSPEEIKMQMIGGGATTLAALYAVYAGGAFVVNRREIVAQAGKVSQFIALWPLYRDDAPGQISALIEPIYKKFSIDGHLTLKPQERIQLFQLLRALMSAQVHEIEGKLAVIRRAHKQREKEMKERSHE
ncbi:MAG: hypothetical protein QG604_683 [Candidatus Dependentiae bacterium]|nr:hypothetical protein [Candidatus Dependentiae bacterium]